MYNSTIPMYVYEPRYEPMSISIKNEENWTTIHFSNVSAAMVCTGFLQKCGHSVDFQNRST